MCTFTRHGLNSALLTGNGKPLKPRRQGRDSTDLCFEVMTLAPVQRMDCAGWGIEAVMGSCRLLQERRGEGSLD